MAVSPQISAPHRGFFSYILWSSYPWCPPEFESLADTDHFCRGLALPGLRQVDHFPFLGVRFFWPAPIFDRLTRTAGTAPPHLHIQCLLRKNWDLYRRPISTMSG